jgi:signal transduction histidine kinase
VVAGVIMLAAWRVPDVIDARAGLPSVHQDMGFFVLAALAVAAGMGVRALREQSDTLRRALDDLDAERAAHAATVAAAERRRIARDMHDVLTHTVSAVAVQAGALRLRLSSGPEAEAVARIEGSSREAMRELRQLLDLLRDDTPGLAPSPGLDDIDRLLDPLTGTRVTVQLHRHGTLGEVAPGPALVAYHLVQESLTNVGKHAGSAEHVDITLEVAGGNLVVTVVDDGLPQPRWQPGHGLTGMRERVASYGGQLDVGPIPTGRGWRVCGVLPT